LVLADQGATVMSLDRFAIIESTLREGEQFVNAFFTTEQKSQIARMLDDFGVEYIELTSPAASRAEPRRPGAAIARLGLKAKILTHTCAATWTMRKRRG
jgi:homocitrate synthase